MELIITLATAALIGLIAWFICTLVPFLKKHAQIVGVVVFLIALVSGTTL